MIRFFLSLLNRYRKKNKPLPEKDISLGDFANTKKDSKDVRDFIFTGSAIFLPDVYELNCLDYIPIRNQQTRNSCASHGAVFNVEAQLPKYQYLEGSEQFHYFNARKYINKTFPKDTGMTIRDACKAMKDYGMAPEILCPYDVNTYNNEPSKLSYSFAKLYKISRYERVWEFDGIKESIFNEVPILCGIYVNDDFNKLNKTNYLYTPIEAKGFGHAVSIVGYDNTREVVKLRNSWGTSKFGQNGYFEMPFENFKKTSFDWWRLVR